MSQRAYKAKILKHYIDSFCEGLVCSANTCNVFWGLWLYHDESPIDLDYENMLEFEEALGSARPYCMIHAPNLP